jgi:hypothetical protein
MLLSFQGVPTIELTPRRGVVRWQPGEGAPRGPALNALSPTWLDLEISQKA